MNEDPIVILFLALALTGGGCLAFVVLAALARIFRRPLTYIEGLLLRPWWD